MNDRWEQLSSERKQLQIEGEVPPFMTTAGYSMFVKKYVESDGSVKNRYLKIAEAAGKIADELYPTEDSWEKKFFDIIWKGWLSPATPVLANLGTNRGLPVSCMGSYIDDSVEGFYDSLKEAAVASKHGFGTSAYLGDIRPRGSKFSDNGKASGSFPVFEDFVTMANKISQGSSRRGSWAGYLEVDHPDFYEWADALFTDPANKNIGWIFTQDFIDRMISGDEDALQRYQRVLKIRAVLGKGYIWKVDTVNAQQTESFKTHGLINRASNLCSEIVGAANEEMSYTCVLSSLNLSKYDEWKGTDLIFTATVFLDSVNEAFIRQAKDITGLEKLVKYAEKTRMLGLGVMGYHDLLQQKMIPFESEDARALNNEIFSKIKYETNDASIWMSKMTEIPQYCVGRRNSHLTAVAPTMSTALIVGSTSQGIEPFVANVWNQSTAAGEMSRLNPNLIDIMKKRGVYNQETIDNIINHGGSVQNEDWLSPLEREVFKTAFEIDQEEIIKQASDRQEFIEQGQSLNLFFDADASPKEISRIHKIALLDEKIKGLYYVRSKSGVQASKKEGIK